MLARLSNDASCVERVEYSMSCVGCCVVDDETARCDLPSDDDVGRSVVELYGVVRWAMMKQR